MELFYRRPSINTRKAMSMAALNIKHSSNGIYEEIVNAEEGIKKFTQHEYVKVVNSGNSAILSVISSFKGKIMIPD
ncbi:MAG: cell wall biogenesis protein, partial [Methanobacterium sp.]